MKTFVVSDDCVSCGLCLQETDLLVEDAVGKAKPAEKCIINDLKKAEKIVADCPVGAISIVEKGDIKQLDEKTIRELPSLLKRKLQEVKKPTIDIDDVKMDANKYTMSYPEGFFVGDYRYEYSSESSAIRAAMEKFDRYCYSQYARFITEVLVQYREDKLKKYYCFDKKSFWGEANNRYEKILKDFAAELEVLTGGSINLGESFIKFEAYPGGESNIEKNNYLWILKHFDEYQIIPRIMSDFHSNSYTSKSSYETYIDTDEMEVYAGRGFFGGDNYKTKYCYCSSQDILKEFLGDLKSSINYVDVHEKAFDSIKSAIESYNREVDKIINSKIAIVQKSFQNLNGVGCEIKAESKKIVKEKLAVQEHKKEAAKSVVLRNISLPEVIEYNRDKARYYLDLAIEYEVKGDYNFARVMYEKALEYGSEEAKKKLIERDFY